jgi:hypothetical protein
MPSQVFVRGLDGRTRCVDFPGDASRGVSLGRLSRALARAPWGAPEAELLVSCGARVYAPAREPRARLPAGSACSLLLRVAGGKGGFGSLLRGAGTSGAATTNQDACRDLSGRRIRHVEAERKLREHARTQPQRDLERLALAHINQKTNGVKRKFEKIEEQEKERYARDSGAVVDAVAASVRAGLASRRDGAPFEKKTSQISPPARSLPYMGDPGLLRGGVSDDSDDSDDSGSDVDEASAARRRRASANGASKKGAAEKTKKSSAPKADEKKKADEDADASKNVVSVSSRPVPSVASDEPAALLVAGGGGGPEKKKENVTTAPAGHRDEEEEEARVDLTTFADATALEAVGLDVLKRELKLCGLKCGGTLAQRAERLFLLKGTCFEALDAKHKAK